MRVSSLYKGQTGQVFDNVVDFLLVSFLIPSLRGISMLLDWISCCFGGPFLINLGNLLGCVFKVSFDKQFRGVKNNPRTNRKGVPGCPGPHQEALS